MVKLIFYSSLRQWKRDFDIMVASTFYIILIKNFKLEKSLLYINIDESILSVFQGCHGLIFFYLISKTQSNNFHTSNLLKLAFKKQQNHHD